MIREYSWNKPAKLEVFGCFNSDFWIWYSIDSNQLGI